MHLIRPAAPSTKLIGISRFIAALMCLVQISKVPPVGSVLGCNPVTVARCNNDTTAGTNIYANGFPAPDLQRRIPKVGYNPVPPLVQLDSVL